MNTFRIKLKPRGCFITPLHADTLFGHLCWIVRWRDGEAALKEFLEAFEDSPPIVFSDGFPGDLLPAPAHLPTLVRDGFDHGDDEFDLKKKLKSLKWLTLEEFRKVQDGRPIRPMEEKTGIKPTTSLHSSINRISGTTGDEGSLFELEEYVLEEGLDYYSIYLKIKEEWIDRVASFFHDLSLIGYGKKKSVGKGAFEVLSLEPFNGFDFNSTPDGFVALSHFVPAEGDPTDGSYKIFVKYGKLGGEFAFSGKPFKRPLMMLKVGSIFRCKEQRPYYGRMVKGLVPGRPEIVNYGYTFPVPIRM